MVSRSNINHPKHYNLHPSGIECIDVVEHLTFCIGNAIKYLWRADYKNGTEDLEKAIWYIKREIQHHVTNKQRKNAKIQRKKSRKGKRTLSRILQKKSKKN